MSFPFVYLVIVSCFISVIHVSAVPQDPKSVVQSHDSKTASKSHDTKPAELSKDTKHATLPKDSKPEKLPKDSKPEKLPKDSKPEKLPKDSKPAKLPKDPKPVTLPTDLKPAELSKDPKPAELPQDPKPAELSQDPKLAAQPQGQQPAIPPGLSEDYYAKTCPNFEKILQEVLTPKQAANPTTAAATLRVFFHDCFVEGCDGSVLVNPTPAGTTERDNPLNLDLPGDAFDVIVRSKQALDISCPGIVSCSDILAAATRELVKQVGGPFYKVLLGKKDGKVSIASHVDHNLTDEKTTFDNMLAPFLQKGFTVRDMVALLGGGHTIGFAHCTKFANRIFKFSPTAEVDPALNPAFAQRLRTLCADYIAKPELAAFMDPLSAGKFDNNYFLNVMRGLDILPSDHLLLNDPRSKPLVEEYAKDQNKFFADFVQAMEKLNVLGVKTGADGEIRTNCFAFNSKP